MGLFGFKGKKQASAEKLSTIRNGNFGVMAKNVYCVPVKAIERICIGLDCSAHLAFVPSPDDVAADYPVYTLKIFGGEIDAGDHADLLQFLFSRSAEERTNLLRDRFGMDEAEAENLDACGIQYQFREASDTIEFASECVASYLKYADVHDHLKVLGQILHEELPNACVLSDSRMVFVMLNGGDRGKYEER